MTEKCHCGQEHHSYQCVFLDFGDCDLFTEDEAKIWVGFAPGEDDEEGEYEDVVQIIRFETRDGSISADFQMTPDEADALAELLTHAATRSRLSMKSEPAISKKDVQRYHRNERRRDQRLRAKATKGVTA